MFQIQIICGTGNAYPVPHRYTDIVDGHQQFNNETKFNENGEIISVRITSSVAVGRGGKGNSNSISNSNLSEDDDTKVEPVTVNSSSVAASEKIIVTELPPEFAGANLEFIKQLNAKKEAKALQKLEHTHPLQINKHQNNETAHKTTSEDSGSQSFADIPFSNDEDQEYSDDIPIARSIPFIPKDVVNYEQPLGKPFNEIRIKPKVTTVSFNIVHDPPNIRDDSAPFQSLSPPINQPQTFFNEPSKVYSQPAKIYGEPAKVYGEPAKIYGEPAKIYGEPAKIYGEPARIYSEPAKFYSKPASLHLQPNNENNQFNNKLPKSIIETVSSLSEKESGGVQNNGDIIENKYDINNDTTSIDDTKGSQNSTTENNKVGYVVEGKDYRKYRVEERTADGFIVGEYGVVRNEDGALRGVRYTADGEASPSLIYDGLMKFLQL